MRLCVSVPVLSVHSTVAAPSASMAAGRRVSTLCCDMRQAPIAMNTVSTSGNSSGSIAMAIVMPASAAASQPPWVHQYSADASTLTSNPSTVNQRTSWRVCRCSGVTSGSIAPSTLPI